MKSFKIYLEEREEEYYHKLLDRRFEWFDTIEELMMSLRKSFPEESLPWDSSKAGDTYDVFGVPLQILKHNIFYNIGIVRNMDTGQFSRLKLSELEQLGKKL